VGWWVVRKAPVFENGRRKSSGLRHGTQYAKNFQMHKSKREWVGPGYRTWVVPVRTFQAWQNGSLESCPNSTNMEESLHEKVCYT
jgi:hypothetical protein